MKSFDDPWDEHQWEAHINQLQRKTTKIKSFIQNSWGDPLPVWLRFVKDFENVEEALTAWIDEELSYEDAWFPDDLESLESDDISFEYLSGEDLDELDEDDELELEDGEEWKSLINDYSDEEFEIYEYDEDGNELIDFDDFQYYLYEESVDLSLYFMYRTKEYKDSIHHAEYLTMVDDVLHISKYLSYSLSFSIDEVSMLGAIITYLKKSLDHANKTYERLPRMRSLFNNHEYRALSKKVFELRNDIGLFIQDLRESFNALR